MGDNKVSGMDIASAGLGAVGALGNMLGIGDKRRARQQVEQQKKLQEIQIQGCNKPSDATGRDKKNKSRSSRSRDREHCNATRTQTIKCTNTENRR